MSIYIYIYNYVNVHAYSAYKYILVNPKRVRFFQASSLAVRLRVEDRDGHVVPGDVENSPENGGFTHTVWRYSRIHWDTNMIFGFVQNCGNLPQCHEHCSWGNGIRPKLFLGSFILGSLNLNWPRWWDYNQIRKRSLIVIQIDGNRIQ